MLPKDKKLCSATLPPDVLRNLPENVLDDILIRVPLRDAVRTSILSKKWRYNWCRLPELTLDQTLWDSTNQSIPFVTRFTDIIYHLLVLHVGPITKFILSDIANLGNYSKIDNLVLFLSRNGIQHLVLQFPKDKPYILSSLFFTCLQMRHLSLRYCSVQPPPTFKGFSELVSLELYEVTISSKILENLISHNLLLERLVLQISSILDHIKIDAPKLKSFDFTGNIELISLKKVPFLVELLLFNTVVPSPEAGQHYFTKYFESFPTLEHLHLDYHSLQFLAAGSGDIEAKLSSPLNYLKCLCLSYICLDELAELSPALCLIRGSPYLQDIQIKIEYVALDKLVVPVSIDVVNEIPSSFSDVTLDHLRSVKLEGITGTKTEIEFIKLLLSKSPVLLRMLIQQKIANVSAETRLKVVTEITKFPRASPKAEVYYNSGV
ncbi:F-box/FBD/LRR-repeat protein At1g13570-like [Solanum stenotomum]|uniref:F-box/FBD/LRR-repeat protein At1g13570-like n=1 Tax=Solanum stenotomum TaxID=172797 RepID=UPI0020D0940F|nr:F-box/FBD/LRR-repeat protein At1g13570-like [Solanum stenotomum]